MIWRTIHSSRSQRRGFSLIEVLLAVFILGIGVISIAALFPAGILQQRLANEDVMGPIVANSAISVLRSKLDQNDFGSFEDYRFNNNQYAPDAPTLPGDWSWLRPSTIHRGLDEGGFQPGSIDIFSNWYVRQEFGSAADLNAKTEFPDGWPAPGTSPTQPELYGIPYNRVVHNYRLPSGEPLPPRVVVTQKERYYPMGTSMMAGQDADQPQYVWDCMFRRYQGRIQVAIFVYRVSRPGGEPLTYVVQPNPPDMPAYDSRRPALPMKIDLRDFDGDHGDWYTDGVWDVAYDGDIAQPLVPGIREASLYDPYDPRQSWQEPRQWLLDQNSNIHRVVGIDEEAISARRVQLARPLAPVSLRDDLNPVNTFDNPLLPTDAPQYYFADPSTAAGDPNLSLYLFDRGVTTHIWYIPRYLESVETEVELRLTPVYVTVKEL